jgi:hypothetical protein
MTPEGNDILTHLHSVAAERRRRTGDTVLAERVLLLKAYQHRRFALTYADMLGDARFAAAARFFLDDLYGPHDFSERDDQFARIVPALVRLFPKEIVSTVRALAGLHALSEVLDTQMALALGTHPLDAAQYLAAWRHVGRAAEREEQIALMLTIGTDLDRYTRNPLLRHSLRLMRVPARGAGMGELQRFLEKGFETFRAMREAGHFLATIATRERALAAALFDPQAETAGISALARLP